jgi:hypothetical protein
MISIWHKKSNTLFYSSPNQTPPPPPYSPCPPPPTNNNNNNNGRSHNRYVIPAAGPSAAQSKIPIGGYRRPAAVAANNSGRKAPIRRATAPVARVSPSVAPSNIPSLGASNGSYNSAPAERTSGYIRRGRIVPTT